MKTFTKGPWKKKGSTVTSNNPSPGVHGSDDTDYYGGHLICESVNDENGLLIAQAPEMYDLLRTIENDDERLPGWLMQKIELCLLQADPIEFVYTCAGRPYRVIFEDDQYVYCTLHPDNTWVRAGVFSPYQVQRAIGQMVSQDQASLYEFGVPFTRRYPTPHKSVK